METTPNTVVKQHRTLTVAGRRREYSRAPGTNRMTTATHSTVLKSPRKSDNCTFNRTSLTRFHLSEVNQSTYNKLTTRPTIPEPAAAPADVNGVATRRKCVSTCVTSLVKSRVRGPNAVTLIAGLQGDKAKLSSSTISDTRHQNDQLTDTFQF